MTRNIIDVSHWEDPIDFGAVAANGIVAVIPKATQGAAGVDSAYAKFRKAAAPYKFLWAHITSAPAAKSMFRSSIT
jgi:lysozyme